MTQPVGHTRRLCPPTPKSDSLFCEVLRGGRLLWAFVKRISGPLLGRLDIHIEAPHAILDLHAHAEDGPGRKAGPSHVFVR